MLSVRIDERMVGNGINDPEPMGQRMGRWIAVAAMLLGGVTAAVWAGHALCVPSGDAAVASWAGALPLGG